jgi:outer membrane protein OmpA-like peptidoglycan-associated protein
MTARLALYLMVLVALVLPPVHAQNEVPGAADHPLIQRFDGSRLIGYRQADWEESFFPTQSKSHGGRWVEPLRVEGRLTRLVYLAPAGKSRTEVHRNYEQALVAAGLKPRFSCELRSCEGLYGAMANTLAWRNAMRFSPQPIRSDDGRSNFSAVSALSYEEVRFLYGTLSRNGADWHVLVVTTQAVNKRSDSAATFIQIIEPKAMQTGQVSVDATAISQGLQAEGKVTLTGLFFDTGKSELKPESKPQLEEMAKLLQAQPAAKVFIVGHTDNVGAFDANVALSLARAQAVVAALGAAPYKVDVKRLSAKGAANIAPVASNADEAGRAKNRRVELVLQ